MRRVLFADDDILLVNRLYTLIDWNEWGYQVVGIVMDGGELLDNVKNLKPDLLILDIDLPKKTGVELMKIFAEEKITSTMAVLVLSNHNNFEYVRSTMYHGAFDYLLKHELTADTLCEKLKEITEVSVEDDEANLKNQYVSQATNQKLLSLLLQAEDIPDNDMVILKQQPFFEAQHYTIGIVQITNFILWGHFHGEKARATLTRSISTFAENLFATLENGVITYTDKGQFAILFSFQKICSYQEIIRKSNSYLEVLSKNISKIFSVDSLYEISNVYDVVLDTRRHYEQTIQKINQTPWVARKEEPENFAGRSIIEEKKLLDFLLLRNTNQVLLHLEKIAELFFSSNPLHQQIQHYLIKLFTIGIEFLQSQGVQRIELEELTPPIWNQTELTKTDFITIVQTFYSKILEIEEIRATACYSLHVQKVLCYIHKHYKEEISLASVAKEVSISQAHLSRLFTKEMKLSFTEYLTQYRIKTAEKLLLEREMPVKSVCKEVGFQNYNYFLRVFKEETGKTVSQVQKNSIQQ